MISCYFANKTKQLTPNDMNENLNLVELLKHVPEGTKFYTTVQGDVFFNGIDIGSEFPIKYKMSIGDENGVTSKGLYLSEYEKAECVFFPSKDQRDWKVWARQSGINYSTGEPGESKEHVFKPFDKVLVRDEDEFWSCDLFVGLDHSSDFPFVCISGRWLECIPYEGNEHLLWTNKNLNSHE